MPRNERARDRRGNRERAQSTGIGGSDRDKRIRWYMNNQFRLALLKSLSSPKDPEQVIAFARYGAAAQEPEGFPRNWTLFGAINQK